MSEANETMQQPQSEHVVPNLELDARHARLVMVRAIQAALDNGKRELARELCDACHSWVNVLERHGL